MELISQAEYARRVKKDKGLISRHVKHGRIILENGKVNPVQADQALGYSSSGDSENVDSEKKGQGKNYWEEKTRRESAEASLKELELAFRRKELVEVEVVSQEFSKLVDAVRQKLLAIPSKIAPITHQQKTIAATRQIIEQGIHEALNEFGSYNPKTGKSGSSRAPNKNRGASKKAKATAKAKG